MLLQVSYPKLSSMLQLHYLPHLFARFSAENKANLNADAYQAFGLGPRKCVAERLSMLYMQLVLSRVMTEFCISLDEERHKVCILNVCPE